MWNERKFIKAEPPNEVRSALKVEFNWDIDHSLSSVTKATREAAGV